MRKVSYGNALFYVCCVSSVGAFDYKFSGVAESVSKVGFNHSPINSKKGIFPTESFVTLTVRAQVDTTFFDKGNHKVSGGLGGAMGALAYDDTTTLVDQSTGQVYGSKLAYFYMGRWIGFLNNAPWKKSNIETTHHARPYVLYNAFLRYDYKDVLSIIAGRYASKAAFMSGYTQGFEVSYKFLSCFKLHWISSFGRALAVGEFIRPWYSPVTTTNKKGQVVNLGIHAVGLNYDTRYFSAVSFVYFSPNTYTTPGFKLYFNSNPLFEGIGLKSLTTMTVVFPIYDPRVYDNWYRGSMYGKWASSIYIHQRFDYDQYNFGGGYFQNFGNPAAKIFLYGSPIVIDIRDDSVYGGLMNNMLSPNSITGYLFAGGVHKKIFWGLVGRLTFSPRANEQSLAWNLGIKWSHYISTLFYSFVNEVDTHKGYNIANWYTLDPSVGATHQDRRFLMTAIKAQF
ncbi:outer membrane family protein [Helicobacter suis]|uniref:outer membrane family protein n=1 Tax=Helicobacter suis TaxID=104628 RepID=UPI0022067B8D|nr:outer membrane family protein [Helicobacter suis]BDR28615.1 membrane protein [Helicobacter suis HS1]